MGITRILKRLVLLGTSLFCLTFAGLSASTVLWPDRAIDDIPSADAIICLAAGLRKDGRLSRFSRQRAVSCIELYHAGKAPRIVFTGGNTTHDAPPTGAQMGALARDQGVPAVAILTEERSQSTLQNALFTLPMLPRSETVILVTDSFHLPRSIASFKWAGANAIVPVATLPEPGGQKRRMPGVSALLRETAATGFNLARLPIYWLPGLLGVDAETRSHILQ